MYIIDNLQARHWNSTTVFLVQFYKKIEIIFQIINKKRNNFINYYNVKIF
jgi:hypothetical protein